MSNRIILKRSSVSAKVPAAADLSVGELAINLSDRRLYSKDGSGSVFGITVDASQVTSGTLASGLLSGTYGISISGNAGSVTNGVYTTGSYADPAWLTSLAKSKVGLSEVENTALSTWAGSANITTIGTLGSLSVLNSSSGYYGTLATLTQQYATYSYQFNFLRCLDAYGSQIFQVRGDGYAYLSSMLQVPNLQVDTYATLRGGAFQTSVPWYWNGSYYVYDTSNRISVSNGSNSISIGTSGGAGSTTYLYNTKYVYGGTYFWDYTYLYGYTYFYGSYFYFGSSGFTCDGMANLRNVTYSQYGYGNWSGSISLDFSSAHQINMTLGGDLTFGAMSNKSPGRTLTVIMQAGAATRYLYFPVWTWVGPAPVYIGAGKTGRLALRCVGYGEADVVAEFIS